MANFRSKSTMHTLEMYFEEDDATDIWSLLYGETWNNKCGTVGNQSEWKWFFWIADCILILEFACCHIEYILCTLYDNLVNKDILFCPQKSNNSCNLTIFFTSLKPDRNHKWNKFQGCQCGHVFFLKYWPQKNYNSSFIFLRVHN